MFMHSDFQFFSMSQLAARLRQTWNLELEARNFSLSLMAAAELDIKYVAHLARITLTLEEEQHLGPQLARILGHIEKLKELDVNGVEPTAHAVPLVNVTRPDEVRPSLPHDEAMRNAPAQANGLFTVPKIVE